jgi:hypothetical protein
MGKEAKLTKLDNKSKVRLLRSWLNYLYQETNTWEVDEVGAHIAYLCQAVLNDDKVEWKFNNPVNQLILKKDPKCKSVIWIFITLVPNER